MNLNHQNNPNEIKNKSSNQAGKTDPINRKTNSINGKIDLNR